ncbi:MAG: toprim domain-containing protein [Candidatus Bathyarchaeota archaeon]|nr:toprim domain-containing protein [Candidatus Termiticorpusculum sp.]
MLTKLRDRHEKIEYILAKLVEESKAGTPIVVEGKKDADNLKHLGVEGRIVTIKTSGKSFLDAVSEIETSGTRRVVLFLDFDRRGKEGTKRLVTELERLHIKVNVWFWRELGALVNRDVQCIESLPNYLKTLKKKASSKTETYVL